MDDLCVYQAQRLDVGEIRCSNDGVFQGIDPSVAWPREAFQEKKVYFLSMIEKFAARQGVARLFESDAWTSSRYSPFGSVAIGISRAMGMVVLPG
jgi:hypothetical protein